MCLFVLLHAHCNQSGSRRSEVSFGSSLADWTLTFDTGLLDTSTVSIAAFYWIFLSRLSSVGWVTSCLCPSFYHFVVYLWKAMPQNQVSLNMHETHWSMFWWRDADKSSCAACPGVSCVKQCRMQGLSYVKGIHQHFAFSLFAVNLRL